MDFDGEPTKAGMVEVMLREMSRDTILTLKSVKQTERFLHLDSWSTQHADEPKPPRVVGFFPSNTTAGYAVFQSMARKLQDMISFGEVRHARRCRARARRRTRATLPAHTRDECTRRARADARDATGGVVRGRVLRRRSSTRRCKRSSSASPPRRPSCRSSRPTGASAR